jgi:hypothetical protein
MVDPTSNTKPSLGFIDAPSSFKDDLAVLDRYQAFSAEVLRIALLGLSGLGAVIFKLFFDEKVQTSQFQSPWVRLGIMFSAIAFGVAATAALLHRYCSSDSMTCHLEMLRLERVKADQAAPDEGLFHKITRERESRNRMLKISAWSTLIGSFSVAIGGLAFVVVIGGVLLH